MANRKRERCGKGHSDWFERKDGRRQCRTCQQERALVQARDKSRAHHALGLTYKEFVHDYGQAYQDFIDAGIRPESPNPKRHQGAA